MIVGARRASLSISETGELLEFHRQPSLGFTENGLKKRTYPVNGICADKNCLVDVRGQRRISKLVCDNKNATLVQISTCYHQGTQNT